MAWTPVLLPAMLAALVTLLLTPWMVRLAVRIEAVDRPGGRRRHRGEMPRLGGVAIFGGIVVSLVPSALLFSGNALEGLSGVEAAGFAVSVLIVFALGVVDDVVGLSPYTKLAIQLLAAAILVAIGWQFTVLRLPWEGRFYLGAVAPLLSILWIVGVTNAINLIDGLDGLAAGLVAIISASLLVLAVLQRRFEIVVVASSLLGACVGFLRHNWRPAKIYMGDSGSLTLGFILAAITLRSSVKASATLAILVPILALGLPLFDTVLVMWYRFLRGHRHLNRFARMFHADRKHLHHLLLETHTERSKAMLTLYGLGVGFCVMALVVAASGSIWLGVAFLGVEFAVVMLIRRAGLNASARRLADERLRRLERAEDGGERPAVGALGAPALEPEVEPVESATK